MRIEIVVFRVTSKYQCLLYSGTLGESLVIAYGPTISSNVLGFDTCNVLVGIKASEDILTDILGQLLDSGVILNDLLALQKFFD